MLSNSSQEIMFERIFLAEEQSQDKQKQKVKLKKSQCTSEVEV